MPDFDRTEEGKYLDSLSEAMNASRGIPLSPADLADQRKFKKDYLDSREAGLPKKEAHAVALEKLITRREARQ